jgi:hypothetical protein
MARLLGERSKSSSLASRATREDHYAFVGAESADCAVHPALQARRRSWRACAEIEPEVKAASGNRG